MAPKASTTSLLSSLLLLVIFASVAIEGTLDKCKAARPRINVPVFPGDTDVIQFALNLEHLEAEFFLYSALGEGLDAVAPELVGGGPKPIGAKKANLDEKTKNIIEEFAYQEVGHLRAIKSLVGGFPRPQLDLSPENFAKIFDAALGSNLSPPFDPYANSINYLLASYLIPYVGLVGYVGANPIINGHASKRLLAGLLAVESGQDAVIRALLYEHADEVVEPYKLTVAEFTRRLSNLRNKLAGCGRKDEGLFVAEKLGAERRTRSNVLSADKNSVAYARTPAEILRVVYGTGDEGKPGGFLPQGGNGTVARSFL